MLAEYLPQTNILALPPEIIVKIVSKLPLADVENIRLTCSAFNEVGSYVQMTSLHRLRNKADSVLRRCHSGFCDVTEARALRALRGTASVTCLTGIVKIADASTFYFILDRMLPPVPASLLADVEKALDIASRRNPLVGKDRLKRIFSGFNKYFTTSFGSLKAPLKTTSSFRTAMDLLAALPLKTCTIVQTEYGLHCLVYLNFLTVMVNKSGSSLTLPLLIQFLVKLNIKGMQELININMGNLFVEEFQPVEDTIYLIELMIACVPEECLHMNSLKQICRLEPKDFQVRLHGVAYVRPPGERNAIYVRNPVRGRPLEEGEELAAYTFSSLPPEVFNRMYSTNPISIAV